MAYFSGEYDCTIDAKGRMMLPAKVKSRLPENYAQEIVVQRSTDPCLVIYPQPEWEQTAARVSALNEFDENTAMLQRNFMRGCTEVELDGQGRFLIPKRMLDHAGISKEAVLVGLGNRLELWNPEIYDAYLIKDPKQLSSLLQKHLGTNKEA